MDKSFDFFKIFLEIFLHFREKLTINQIILNRIYSFKNIDKIDLTVKYLEDIIMSRFICIAINWYILYTNI